MTETQKKKIIRGVITVKKRFCFVLSLLILVSSFSAFALTYDELLRKAADYAGSGQYDKAFACYDLAARSEPDNPAAYIQAGLLHLDRGDPAAAGESIEKAIAADPTSPDAWLAKCRLDIATEDTAALEADLLYAEICGADVSVYAEEIEQLYGKTDGTENAASSFSQADDEPLNDDRKTLVPDEPISRGETENAASPGPDTARVHSKKLDAAFDSGDPRLEETASASVKPQASDFEFTDEAKAFLKDSAGIDDIDAALAEVLKDTEFVLLSKSPAGNSGLVSAGETAVAFYNGKYHYVYPSAKGAADEYSNLQQYYTTFSSRFTMLLGEEGIVYSPDGKYAFIGNKRITLMQMKLFIDPILLDLSTGELILTAAYPNKVFKEENAGAVSSALFSSDNQYFYYVLFGIFDGGRIRLNRYHLDTGETETCFVTEKNLYYPNIAELKDGSILMLSEGFRLDDSVGLVIASPHKGTWVFKEEELKLPQRLFYPTQLTYSPNAERACLLGNNTANGGAATAFQLINPENNFEGIDQFWCIRKDTNELLSLSPKEYQEALAADEQNKEEGNLTGLSLLYPYQTILKAIFSPDGRYLLVHTLSNSTVGDSRNLFLIRLEDMTLRKVSGLAAEKIPLSLSAGKYPMNFEWNTDELIIGTDEGIRTFTFTDGQ